MAQQSVFLCLLLHTHIYIRRFQSQLPDQERYTSVPQTLGLIAREEGLTALYKVRLAHTARNVCFAFSTCVPQTPGLIARGEGLTDLYTVCL